MRTLHVIATMDPKQGGVCQAVRTMAAGLNNLDVHNDVVSFDDPGADFFKDEAFTIHPLGRGKGPWSYNSNFVGWLLSNLPDYDVVILHGLWLYNGFGLKKAIKMLKRKEPPIVLPKLFIMPHGMLDPYFQFAPERRLKAIRNIIYWNVIEKELINEADGLLFTCEEELRLANKTFNGYRPKQKLVIGMGVESPPSYQTAMTDAFTEKCEGLQNSPYLLFLSRIHEKKGVDLLLKAYSNALMKEVKDKGELKPLPKLVIAGPGLETVYGNKIKQLVSENKALSETVFLTGMLSGSTKWGAFYGCEAFILPSHQENFGIAVVEALACGKPVLISNQVNIWREIENDGGCCIAENTVAGAGKLLDAWQQSTTENKKRMSRNALYSFQKNFSALGAANRLLNAIKN